ncbi:exported hypothetical protein [Candidatus Desulfarcum epimagneticum]|uniref:F5/8 type C domain-containing protein n=1 Tax=uncultured Desulfobacteraceae bacterium TaxID=218296 RepID=A0A484HEP3_9BACT|nr:exported hypothetical protein [uncultured Desulfobacteraceae bacterium]
MKLNKVLSFMAFTVILFGASHYSNADVNGLRKFSEYQCADHVITSSHSGFSGGNLCALTDGVMAPQGTPWDHSETNVWWENDDAHFIISYGRATRVWDFQIQAGCDDQYRIEYSKDGEEYTILGVLGPSCEADEDGVIKTASSHPESPYYVEGMFPDENRGVEAEFLRISAFEGDGRYAVSEFQTIDESFGFYKTYPRSLSPFPLPPKPVFLPGDSIIANIPCDIISSQEPFLSTEKLTDGVFAPDRLKWTHPENFSWHKETDYGRSLRYFLFELPEPADIYNINVQVDNNDSYLIEYSIDGENYEFLAIVDPSHRKPDVRWGMKTVSSHPESPYYVEGMFPNDKRGVTARFLRISAFGGDNEYAVNEFQVFDEPINPVQIDPVQMYQNSTGMNFVAYVPDAPILSGITILEDPLEDPGAAKNIKSVFSFGDSSGDASTDSAVYIRHARPEIYFQTTEVTQRQWRAVMGYNASHFDECGEDCPVGNVSFKEALEFIDELNQLENGSGFVYRLPTKKEYVLMRQYFKRTKIPMKGAGLRLVMVPASRGVDYPWHLDP